MNKIYEKLDELVAVIEDHQNKKENSFLIIYLGIMIAVLLLLNLFFS